jgi:hypothetical protein
MKILKIFGFRALLLSKSKPFCEARRKSKKGHLLRRREMGKVDGLFQSADWKVEKHVPVIESPINSMTNQYSPDFKTFSALS